MNIIDLFKEFYEAYSDALRYAEYEFYKLKDDIVNLLRQANSRGYNNPDYCQLTIDVKNSNQTIVKIELYFKKSGSKVQRFSRTLDLGSLVLVPELIKEKLKREHFLTIELDVNDLRSIYGISTSEITAQERFENLERFNFKGIQRKATRKELSIKDDLFYYTVEATCYYNDDSFGGEQKETKRRYFGYIKNMPPSVLKIISSDPDHVVVLDVTNN